VYNGLRAGPGTAFGSLGIWSARAIIQVMSRPPPGKRPDKNPNRTGALSAFPARKKRSNYIAESGWFAKRFSFFKELTNALTEDMN